MLLAGCLLSLIGNVTNYWLVLKVCEHRGAASCCILWSPHEPSLQLIGLKKKQKKKTEMGAQISNVEVHEKLVFRESTWEVYARKEKSK